MFSQKMLTKGQNVAELKEQEVRGKK